MNNTTQHKTVAQHKAKAIICSCKTTTHLNVASKYIDLFHNMFEDILTLSDLNDLLSKKKKEIIKQNYGNI